MRRGEAPGGDNVCYSNSVMERQESKRENEREREGERGVGGEGG